MQERRRAKPRKTRQKIKAKITVGKKAAEKRKGKMKDRESKLEKENVSSFNILSIKQILYRI